MTHTEWEAKRYRAFNEKINHFKDHRKYGWLRQYANEAIKWNGCVGFYQIKAEDFIERIEKATLGIIGDWLDGKNELEWDIINPPKPLTYIPESVLLDLKSKGFRYERIPWRTDSNGTQAIRVYNVKANDWNVLQVEASGKIGHFGVNARFEDVNEWILRHDTDEWRVNVKVCG